jgi:hypothetical protein
VGYAYLLLIIALGNNMFYLIPGGLKTLDAGLLLIAVGLVYYALHLRRDTMRPLANFFTWYVFYYLLLVAVQVAVAAFYYSQSIVDGALTARHQLYYLSFPLFLLILSDMRKVQSVMKLFVALAAVLIVLSLVNYAGITLFHHQRAEGHGVRSGIVRAFLPAMSVLVMAALWQFWVYLRDKRLISWNLVMFLFCYGGVMFRQTRGRIIAVSFTLVLMMLAKRRYGLLVGGVMLVSAALVAQTFLGEESILVNTFESAYTDVAQGEGTWRARMLQMQASWDVFVDNFLTGSGGLVIHQATPGWAGWGDLLNVAFDADLGYWTWLKFFGYPGIVFLVAMVLAFYWYAYRCGSEGERGYVGRFAAYHFTCILISMVTINYLTQPEGIMILCLTWAMLVRAAQAASEEADFSVQIEEVPEGREPGFQERPQYRSDAL